MFGLMTAMMEILGTGAEFKPAAAKDKGLVDELVATEDELIPAAKAWIKANPEAIAQRWDVPGYKIPGGKPSSPQLAEFLPAFEPLLRSYTSISGPSLDAAAVWLRRAPFHIRDGLKQLAASYYVFAFQLPRLPEAAVRSGVLDKAVNHSANIGITDPERRVRGRRPERDLISGLELYRSNFVRRMLRPRLQVSQVPTQVLAPTDDAHVTVALQTQAPVPYVSDYRWEEIPGNHWVVEHEPAMIAEKIRAFID